MPSSAWSQARQLWEHYTPAVQDLRPSLPRVTLSGDTLRQMPGSSQDLPWGEKSRGMLLRQA